MSNSRHHVLARGLSPDGYGIAFEEQGDREFYVPDLLPLESAWVEVLHESPHTRRSWARVCERTSADSPHRQAPPCPAFGQCGGCAWQHLEPAGQLEQKRMRVETALSKTLTALPVIGTPSSGPQTHYRNKGKYVAAWHDDQLVLGAYKPRSHEVVSTLGCRVVEPAIDEVAREFARLGTEIRVPVYDERDIDRSGLRYVILRANPDGQVLALLVCSSNTPRASIQALADALMNLPSVVGVLRCDNDSKGGVLLTTSIQPLAGTPTLAETSCGIRIELGPAAFWQLNRDQAALAFRKLAAGLRLAPGARVVELYCGVGAISFALAESGYRVLGVEKNSEAIETATEAAREGGLEGLLEFLCADATALEPSILASADAVVVDPPRKGLGEEGCAQLIAAKPEAIAYLSCGPESLARDLATLVEAGYDLERIDLFDFMPGTSQIESLAILRKNTAGDASR